MKKIKYLRMLILMVGLGVSMSTASASNLNNGSIYTKNTRKKPITVESKGLDTPINQEKNKKQLWKPNSALKKILESGNTKYNSHIPIELLEKFPNLREKVKNGTKKENQLFETIHPKMGIQEGENTYDNNINIFKELENCNSLTPAFGCNVNFDDDEDSNKKDDTNSDDSALEIKHIHSSDSRNSMSFYNDNNGINENKDKNMSYESYEKISDNNKNIEDIGSDSGLFANFNNINLSDSDVDSEITDEKLESENESVPEDYAEFRDELKKLEKENYLNINKKIVKKANKYKINKYTIKPVEHLDKYIEKMNSDDLDKISLRYLNILPEYEINYDQLQNKNENTIDSIEFIDKVNDPGKGIEYKVQTKTKNNEINSVTIPSLKLNCLKKKTFRINVDGENIIYKFEPVDDNDVNECSGENMNNKIIVEESKDETIDFYDDCYICNENEGKDISDESVYQINDFIQCVNEIEDNKSLNEKSSSYEESNYKSKLDFSKFAEDYNVLMDDFVNKCKKVIKDMIPGTTVLYRDNNFNNDNLKYTKIDEKYLMSNTLTNDQENQDLDYNSINGANLRNFNDTNKKNIYSDIKKDEPNISNELLGMFKKYHYQTAKKDINERFYNFKRFIEKYCNFFCGYLDEFLLKEAYNPKNHKEKLDLLKKELIPAFMLKIKDEYNTILTDYLNKNKLKEYAEKKVPLSSKVTENGRVTTIKDIFNKLDLENKFYFFLFEYIQRTMCSYNLRYNEDFGKMNFQSDEIDELDMFVLLYIHRVYEEISSKESHRKKEELKNKIGLFKNIDLKKKKEIKLVGENKDKEKIEKIFEKIIKESGLKSDEEIKKIIECKTNSEEIKFARREIYSKKLRQKIMPKKKYRKTY